MSFIWPTMLFSLLLIPLFVALYWRLYRQRQRRMTNYGTMGLMRQAAGQVLGKRRHIPPALFLAGLTLLLLAMARPEATVSLPRLEGTVILAFDVSGSMAAEDLKPNRMEAAKSAAINFVQRQPSTVQVGIVAFAESGLTVQTPTNDQEAILSTIGRLGPERGTSLGQGILAALNTIFLKEEKEPIYTNLTPTPIAEPTPLPPGTYESAAIVLISDGENTVAPDPFEAALIAKDRGVRIYTIGIGSPRGILLKVEGFSVNTRLDEATLKQVAAMTDGVYYNAQNEEELRAVYENLRPELTVKSEKMEVTSLFMGVSLVTLLIGAIFSLLWFSRIP